MLFLDYETHNWNQTKKQNNKGTNISKVKNQKQEVCWTTWERLFERVHKNDLYQWKVWFGFTIQLKFRILFVLKLLNSIELVNLIMALTLHSKIHGGWVTNSTNCDCACEFPSVFWENFSDDKWTHSIAEIGFHPLKYTVNMAFRRIRLKQA